MTTPLYTGITLIDFNFHLLVMRAEISPGNPGNHERVAMPVVTSTYL